MVDDALKTATGTLVGGLGVSMTLGVNLIGVSAFVGMTTVFAGVPAFLYLAQNGDVDPDRVLKAGITLGVGSYSFAVATLFSLSWAGLEQYVLPARLAGIAVVGYLAVVRVSDVWRLFGSNRLTEYAKPTVGTLVAGLGFGFRTGDSYPLVTALVVIGTLLVGLPAVVYLTRRERLDPNRALVTGIVIGAGPFFLPTLTFALGWAFVVLAVASVIRKRA